jgi:hypothetical protein
LRPHETFSPRRAVRIGFDLYQITEQFAQLRARQQFNSALGDYEKVAAADRAQLVAQPLQICSLAG